MKNFKKIDDFDFIFINKSLTEKEDKEFSNFLKERKEKLKHKKLTLPERKRKKELV